MKKIKTLTALVLSIALFSPLFACSQEVILPETPPISSNSSETLPEFSTTPDIESSSPEAPPSIETPEPPASSAPPVSSVPETPTSTQAQYIRCIGTNVNIRSGAGTDFAVLGKAETGTMYAIIGKTGNWYKTYYRNKIAYVYAEYASVFTLETAENDEVEDVIEEGYKLIGVPYVYGAVRLHDGNGKLLSGFSAQKFDCSSLIQYIFYHGAGTLLNVTTRTQVKQGKFVKRSELQRGDCIFFTNAERQHKTGVERIGHVAIYLGDNYILHTASDYARIEPISEKRWSYYVEARRFV